MRHPLRPSVQFFTRVMPALAVPLTLLAACGSDTKQSGSTTAGTLASTNSSAGGTADTDSSAGTDTSSDSASTSAEDCTTESAVDVTTTTAAASSTTTPTKPTVEIPKTLPTKLEITDLTEGTGEPAQVGDTVEVNYVGVRSADGTEFDNSYDRGSTFPVVLGQGSVIQGWEQGLIGIKAGGRRQLDIPADLAYGDQPQGDVIKAGDALTFVIDAVSVTPGLHIPTVEVADKPKVDVKPSIGATKSSFTDLIVGTGDEALAGCTAYVQLIAYRGDTAAELESTWENGVAQPLPLDQQTLPGIVNGIIGMKVGGRRELIITPEDAFGAEGSSSLSLPAGADLIMVVDLVLVQPAGS